MTQRATRLDASASNAIEQIREFLDDVAYSSVWEQYFPEMRGFVFPSIEALSSATAKFRPLYRTLLRMLALGERIDERAARSDLSPAFVDALLEVGLLTGAAAGAVHTNGLLLVSTVQGLNLVVSAPPLYPAAANESQQVYIGPDSLWMIAAIPATLSGKRVLDVCAGSGIQGLVCASRGAARVVSLEKNALAVDAACCNAALNGLADRMDVRQSDLYDALRPGDMFEYLVSNPPFVPMVGGLNYPAFAYGGADGMEILTRIVDEMPRWLTNGGEARLVAITLGTKSRPHFSRRVLDGMARTNNWQVRTWAYRKFRFDEYMERKVEGWRNMQPPGERTEHTDASLKRWRAALGTSDSADAYLHAQTIRIRSVQRPVMAASA